MGKVIYNQHKIFLLKTSVLRTIYPIVSFPLKLYLCIAFLFCLLHFTTRAQETFSQTHDNRMFQSGMDLFEHKQYGGAFISFDEIFQNPASYSNIHSSEAQYYRAYCAINLFNDDGLKMMEDYVNTGDNYARVSSGNFDLANYYYQQKKYLVATDYFKQVDFEVLSDEQKNIGHFRLGYCFLNQNQMNEALEHFNATKISGEQYGPSASYYAGYIEILNKDFDDALLDLKRAELNPAYASVVKVWIAQIYYLEKRYNELINYCEPILAQNDAMNSEVITLLLAEGYSQKGENKKALQFYEKFIDDNEENTDLGVLYRAGNVAYLCKNDDLALKYFKTVAQKSDSIAPFASYYLGVIYIKNNQKPLALTALSISKKVQNNEQLASESIFLSAKINYELGQSDLAISELELLTTSYPNYIHISDAKELLLQAYINANNYNKAIEYFESLPTKSVQIQKVYQKATLLKGMELFNNEDYKEAILFFSKSTQYPIDKKVFVEASFWSGESYSILNDYELAQEQYTKALENVESKPDFQKSIDYGLGYAQFNSNQYSKALLSFRDFANKSNPSESNYCDGLLRLADCYYVAKDYDKALSFYQKALLYNTSDSDFAHLQSGLILSIQRKYPQAGNELELVIKHRSSPFYDDAIVQRAQIEFEQSNYKGAVTWYSKLIENTPNSELVPLALSRRAAANYNLQNYSQTADDYISILTKYPTNPVANDILLHLQEALGLSNRSDELDQYLKMFRKANPDSKAIETVEFEIAQNLYFSQNYKQAVESLNKYLISYPQSALLTKVKFYLAESYYRLKNFSFAIEIYYQLLEEKPLQLQRRILGRIAELEFQNKDYVKAIKAYKNLNNIAETKKEQSNSLMGLVESYFFLKSYDSVSYFAEKILEQGNVSIDATNKATLYLGKSALEKGNYDLAIDEFIATINEGHDESGAEAKYLIGKIFYLNKEHPQCYNTMLELIQEFPSYKVWIGRAYLLLADNFYATDDVFQTKGTLNSLIENFPLQDIKDEAKNKLKEIEDLEQKDKITSKADTIND